MKKDFDYLDFDPLLITNLKYLNKDLKEFWLCPYCLSKLENFYNRCEECEGNKFNSSDIDKSDSMP
jgi:predicted amidophosphoribosyltransferase